MEEEQREEDRVAIMTKPQRNTAEYRKQRRIVIYLDPKVKNDVTDYAKKHGIKTSHAARKLIELGIMTVPVVERNT